MRDRLHLVNRYERLRAVDPEQATRKRASIYERLGQIVERINDANNQLRQNPKIQSKIKPRIGKGRKKTRISMFYGFFFCFKIFSFRNTKK